MSDILATDRLERADVDLVTLAAVERRVLWLATRIVDYANRERPKDDELKVTRPPRPRWPR
jgi:hypothetical protein